MALSLNQIETTPAAGATAVALKLAWYTAVTLLWIKDVCSAGRNNDSKLVHSRNTALRERCVPHGEAITLR